MLQIGKKFKVGFLECELLQGVPVDALERRREACGVGECIHDWQTHVGGAQLCLDGTVFKLYHRVDYRLRVNHHLNVLGSNTEQPLCLHHLESFVHHGCRVDGYFGTHAPIGVLERLLHSDMLQLLFCECAERAARCRENKLLHPVVHLAGKALEDCRVLRVDRQDWCTVLNCQLVYQLAGNNHCLFVGEGNGLACLYGIDCGAQARETDHCGNHNVNGLRFHNLAY